MKNQKSDPRLIPTDREAEETPSRLQAGRTSGYTVIGDTIIDHDDLRRWIRWVMIVIVFAAIVLGVVTGHGVIVGTWTGAIEGALFFVRRWFFSPHKPAPHSTNSTPVDNAPRRAAPSTSPKWRGRRSQDQLGRGGV